MAKWEELSQSACSILDASIAPCWRIPTNKLPPATQLDVSDFPRQSGWFTDRELDITSKTATELLEKLHSQQCTAEEVTRAFCKRAAAAHQLTNCLSAAFFDEAIDRAKDLDRRLKETGKITGPLHGLPISLKDNFNLVGKDSTVGFTAYVQDPAREDAVLVTLLRDAGAVFYVKTNVPTAMMIAESVNNVFGRTVNPLNRALTSGGSSGGESALIAFGGSPLGVGTDIGGSLRIPASLTGIFTLRPSFGRFPTLQCRSGLAGQEAVLSVNGPMSSSLSTVALFARTVVSLSPWLYDPKMLPIPWRSIETKPKLRIAFLHNDGIVTPTPPVQRALKHLEQKLRAAGHEICEWKPTHHPALAQILKQFFVADGGSGVRSILAATDEPFRPEMAAYERAPQTSVADMWQLQIRRTELCKAVLDQWNAVGADCVLSPTTPYAGTKNGEFGPAVSYTGVWNVLDYSCVSFPTGLNADKDLDPKSEHQALNEMDKEVRDNYDAEVVHGIPVSLQLIARRLEEEKVLDMTQTILNAV